MKEEKTRIYDIKLGTKRDEEGKENSYMLCTSDELTSAIIIRSCNYYWKPITVAGRAV
jgi:hypothetical protein